jgi:hypothetical protein
MADLFPRGSIADRRLWAERHPWLAGLYYAALMTPLVVGLAGLRSAEPGTAIALGVLLFPLAWVAFSLLVKRSNRRSRS